MVHMSEGTFFHVVAHIIVHVCLQMSALLDSSGIPQELKYYLPLFCEVVFESPVMRNGGNEFTFKQVKMLFFFFFGKWSKK